MSSMFVDPIPDRQEVDKRLIALDTKVNACVATINQLQLGLHLIEYDVEEEALECHLSKLKHEFDDYHPPTETELDEQKRERARLRRELGLQQTELQSLLATKNEDEVLVLHYAEAIVAKLLAATDAAEKKQQEEEQGHEAEVSERLALRRSVLHEVDDAIKAGLEQKLQLHPVRPKSSNFYYMLSENRAVILRHAPIPPPSTAAGKAAGEAMSLPQDVMHIAVVTVHLDENQRITIDRGSVGVVVTEPYPSPDSDVCGGGMAYRGPLNQVCEPESRILYSRQEEEEAMMQGVPLPEPDPQPGSATYVDGSTYTGLWQRGRREGGGARVTSLNGDVFEGDFRGDAITGSGCKVYANGDKYDGEFVLGVRHGQGTYQCAAVNGGSCYEGGWAADRRTGQGTCVYPEEGYRYAGEWLNDARHGQGTLTALDERGAYEGPWTADSKHGEGAVHFTACGARYDGKWKKGVRCGQASAFSIEDQQAAEQYAAAAASEEN